MNKLIISLMFCIFLLAGEAYGQEKDAGNVSPKEFRISISNTNTTMPVTGFPDLFYKYFRPGIQLAYGIVFKESDHYSLSHSFSLGYFRHRFVQHNVMLHYTIGYNRFIGEKWRLSAGLQAGYLQAFTDYPIYKVDENGVYGKTSRLGRPQAMAGLNIEGGRKFSCGNKEMEVFLAYNPFFQFPFVNSYVPVLPYSSLHLGVKFNLN